MPDICIDLNDLQDVVAYSRQKLAEIDADMSRACSSVASLTARGWEGQARDAFVEVFDDYKKEMKVLYENINASVQALEKTSAKGRQVYARGAGLISYL